MMETRDILVIGAGIAGLSAAELCSAAGCDTLVVDKSRGPGGRMATRRIGEGVFDHGAQSFTAAAPAFRARTELWKTAGAAVRWYDEEGREHLCGRNGMTAVPKHLAGNLPVLYGRRVERLEWARRSWTVIMESGERLGARALVFTPPVPQTLAILRASRIPEEMTAPLAAVRYDPCIALLVLLPAPPVIPPPGFLRPEEGPVAWVADNRRKGISPVSALTIHAGPVWSARHLDDTDEAVTRTLLTPLRGIIGGKPAAVQIHRWRYSRVAAGHPGSHLLLEQPGPLAIGGDAFGGDTIESAAASGEAAARALLSLLGTSAPIP